MPSLKDLLPEGRPLFIAEAGVNHDGDPARALRLVDAAAEAGADAVKFQTFRTSALASAAAPKARYQEETTGGGGQEEMLRRLELPARAHEALVERCRRLGILFLSTPFDEESADLLERLGVPAFKVASPDLTNIPLLEHLARKGRPLILSTGMSTMEEVADAVSAVRGAGGGDFALLHCVSSYPADPADSNLRAMAAMSERFGVPVGFSDHAPGLAVSIAAAALGARVIEKHFTLDRSLPGPDHRLSLEPGELRALALALRAASAALGDGRKEPKPAEEDLRRVARRSLVLARDLEAGTTLGRADLLCKRPGTGIPPRRLGEVVGRRLRGAQKADTVLAWEMVE